MPFSIPNLADAFHADQAEVDKIDLDILVAGYAGTGVFSGCAVTAQGTPDMTVAVASGTVLVAGLSATVASGNVTITTADATNPRFDLVVVSNAGTKSVTAGTAAADPVFPAIPANSAVLAAVYVPASDTAIQSNQIVDKRLILDIANQIQAARLTGAPAGSVAESYPRVGARIADAVSVLTTGKLMLQAIHIPAGVTVTNITMRGSSTAAVSPTNWWFALYDSSLNLLRQTADQTTAAWAANASKTLALTSPFVTTYSGLYYVGESMAAATVNNLIGMSSSGVTTVAPVIFGLTADTGLTATAPNPAGAITGASGQVYIYLT